MEYQLTVNGMVGIEVIAIENLTEARMAQKVSLWPCLPWSFQIRLAGVGKAIGV